MLVVIINTVIKISSKAGKILSKELRWLSELNKSCTDANKAGSESINFLLLWFN